MGKSDIEIAVLRHRRARIREFRHRQMLHAAVVLPAEVINSMARNKYMAATEGNIEEFENLVRDHEVPVLREVTPQGNTILHLAAIYGHILLLERIITHEQAVLGNGNPMPNNYQRLLLRPNFNGDLPLHVAAAAGHALVVGALINHLNGLPVEMQIALGEGRQVGVRDVWVVKNNEGNTALHLALKAKHDAVALNLVEVDERVSFICNNRDESPLYMAAEAGNFALVDQMLQNHPDQLEGKSVVHAAVKSQNIEILNLLLYHYPALIDARDEERRSLLSYVASVGYDRGVQGLLEGVGNMAYVRDPDGFFPIHSACRKGHLGALQGILQFRPDTIELLNLQGQNALHIAAECGKNEVVKYFLRNERYAALINQKDHQGNTPLHLASMFWYPKIVHTLTRDERVNLGELNNLGFTALDAAEECMELNPTFRERLTWMALVCVGTPRALTLMPHDPPLAPGPHDPALAPGPHDPPALAPGPHDPPALAPGPHDPPALAPGPHDPPALAPGPHDPPALAPGPHDPALAPGPHDPPALAPGPHDPPALAPGPHDPPALAPRPQEGIIRQHEMPTAKKYKDRVNTLLLLAILVATVAFSAAFSVTKVPEEPKHWYKPVALQVFVVSNTIAMYSAVLTTVALIWAQLGDLVLILNVFKLVLPLLGLSLISMSFAFVAGMFVVVGNQVWLPVLLAASGGVFLGTVFLLVVPFICPYTSSPPLFRYVLRFPFWLLMLAVWNDTDDDLE